MNPDKIRKDFPQLNTDYIYLDSAATSLKPKSVIDVVSRYYQTTSANVGRGIHRPSYLATKDYEEAHKKVKDFVRGKGEIIFTKNCTEAINIVALGLDWREGDQVISSYLEHNSNLLPWLVLRKKGVEVILIGCDQDGFIALKELEDSITSRTRLIALSYASNVLGTIQPVDDIIEIAHKKGVGVLFDGAQATPHLELDLNNLDCDFFAASGHKMLGPSGTGFLFVKEDALNYINPCLLGGGTVKDVTRDNIIYTDDFERYEAGTPHIAGGIGLGAAISYLQQIGMEKIRNHEKKLTAYAIEKLKSLEGIRIHGPLDPEKKTGVISFSVKDYPSHRVAIILDEVGHIAVRSGFHCAFFLVRDILKEDLGTVRASFYLYNLRSEIDRMVDTLKDIL